MTLSAGACGQGSAEMGEEETDVEGAVSAFLNGIGSAVMALAYASLLKGGFCETFCLTSVPCSDPCQSFQVEG